MSEEIRRERSRRTWWEKLKMWQRAYKTKVSAGSHEATGRGRTPEASQDAAEKAMGRRKSAEKERDE
jgi:hypothetical protein